MVKITKKERDYLVNECGVPCKDEGVSRTYGHNKSYYLCESKRNMEFLSQIRNNTK